MIFYKIKIKLGLWLADFATITPHNSFSVWRLTFSCMGSTTVHSYWEDILSFRRHLKVQCPEHLMGPLKAFKMVDGRGEAPSTWK